MALVRTFEAGAVVKMLTRQNKQWKVLGDNLSMSVMLKIEAPCCDNKEKQLNNENLEVPGDRREGEEEVSVTKIDGHKESVDITRCRGNLLE